MRQPLKEEHNPVELQLRIGKEMHKFLSRVSNAAGVTVDQAASVLIAACIPITIPVKKPKKK